MRIAKVVVSLANNNKGENAAKVGAVLRAEPCAGAQWGSGFQGSINTKRTTPMPMALPAPVALEHPLPPALNAFVCSSFSFRELECLIAREGGD